MNVLLGAGRTILATQYEWFSLELPASVKKRVFNILSMAFNQVKL